MLGDPGARFFSRGRWTPHKHASLSTSGQLPSQEHFLLRLICDRLRFHKLDELSAASAGRTALRFCALAWRHSMSIRLWLNDGVAHVNYRIVRGESHFHSIGLFVFLHRGQIKN